MWCKIRLLSREEQEQYKYVRGIVTYRGLHASKLFAIIINTGAVLSTLDRWKHEKVKQYLNFNLIRHRKRTTESYFTLMMIISSSEQSVCTRVHDVTVLKTNIDRCENLTSHIFFPVQRLTTYRCLDKYSLFILTTT
jgi:hypothetical protein